MFGITGHTTPRLGRGLTAALLSTTIFVGVAAGPAAAADRKGSDALFQIAPTTDWAALERAAARDGSVPVIVQLTVNAKRADRLSKSEHRAQKAKIASARATLLKDDIHHAKPRGLKVSNELPLVAFAATSDDLAALKKSPNTRSVTIDGEVSADLGASVGKGKVTAKSPMGSTPVTGNGVAGTSSNGNANQLTNWWDWYRIGVDKTYAAGWTGVGQTIAVIDTGVDRTHAWLKNKVVNEACFSYSNQAGTIGAGGCPNGKNVQYGTGAAAPCGYNLLCAHGTHTAQTAAGLNGVASSANVIAVQIFHDLRDATHKPTYFESDVVWALSHVYSLRTTYKIAAVNMSIGGGLSTGACDAGPGDGSINATYVAGWIDALKSVGIATVVSSGNDNVINGISRPACVTNAIAVGNTTYDANGYDAVFGGVAGGSNSGSMLDLLAPGTDICSAVPLNLDLVDGVKDGVGCYWIGTSMAAPHVAGAIAVLRQRRAAATVDTMLSTLQRTGVSVKDDRNGIIRSRINLVGALNGI